MHLRLLLIPAAMIASPALSQPGAPPPSSADEMRLPPELTDPAMADRLGVMVQAMSKAFLDLPVGEVKAAAEGRTATAAEKRLTVRDLGRRDDPDFDRNIQRQLAESRGAMQAGMKAMAAAIPAMMKGLSEAAREIEKATANLLSPNYPRR